MAPGPVARRIALATLMAAGALLGAPTSGSASVPASLRHDPARNVAPNPDFPRICFSNGPRSGACRDAEVAAINHARAREHVRPMVLPRNFPRLNGAQQTFVVVNLERVDRGLRPVVGLAPRLNKRARAGASSQSDPNISSWTLHGLQIQEYGAIMAIDFGPLGADYDWVYDDGWSPTGSLNADCPTPGAAGCWGHRDNILGRYHHLPTLVAGAASRRAAYGMTSVTELFVAGSGRPGKLTYTWRKARAAGAGR